ncbi:zinc finger domain protein [Metarhizium robertsii]|uniref:DUF3669 domain-containing protein n=2 Tax=Metarhizium robertsii TaxID=568076 RepID=E9ELX0_METRA|nr:uncharacterized protein MAA_00629 [Metarhizium robertsii ARSEF 23]EFZ03555.2 hypothetical protein MAA_00629 [Metarhizium robertsii ARSEF 23]EXU99993.1 zinc finger domain protein [Metarhizium robertsii]
MESYRSLTASNKPLLMMSSGQCGSVWGMAMLHRHRHHSVGVVIKREHAGPGRYLKNEATLQRQIFTTAWSLQFTSVPQCFDLVHHEDDERWRDLLLILPAGQGKCTTMIAERITAVSRQAQMLLVKKYNWTPTRHRLMQTLESNAYYTHCLVHLYLGRRRPCSLGVPATRPEVFTLCNFPLHVDQMEELQLPCPKYAKAMAESLAMLHWEMRLSGARVKFVLGGRRGARRMSASTPLAESTVWMFDFDRLRPIQANVSGLISIARAFWRNSPYCPRPDSTLWNIFADEYRRVGKEKVQAYPRHGECVETLCDLVDGALNMIVMGQKMWTIRGRF